MFRCYWILWSRNWHLHITIIWHLQIVGIIRYRLNIATIWLLLQKKRRRTLTIHAWYWRHLHWCTTVKCWSTRINWIRSLHLWRTQILALNWHNRWLLAHRYHILMLLWNNFSRSKHPWCWNWGHQSRNRSF